MHELFRIAGHELLQSCSMYLANKRMAVNTIVSKENDLKRRTHMSQHYGLLECEKIAVARAMAVYNTLQRLVASSRASQQAREEATELDQQDTETYGLHGRTEPTSNESREQRNTGEQAQVQNQQVHNLADAADQQPAVEVPKRSDENAAPENASCDGLKYPLVVDGYYAQLEGMKWAIDADDDGVSIYYQDLGEDKRRSIHEMLNQEHEKLGLDGKDGLPGLPSRVPLPPKPTFSDYPTEGNSLETKGYYKELVGQSYEFGPIDWRHSTRYEDLTDRQRCKFHIILNRQIKRGESSAHATDSSVANPESGSPANPPLQVSSTTSDQFQFFPDAVAQERPGHIFIPKVLPSTILALDQRSTTWPKEIQAMFTEFKALQANMRTGETRYIPKKPGVNDTDQVDEFFFEVDQIEEGDDPEHSQKSSTPSEAEEEKEDETFLRSMSPRTYRDHVLKKHNYMYDSDDDIFDNLSTKSDFEYKSRAAVAKMSGSERATYIDRRSDHKIREEARSLLKNNPQPT